MKKVLLSVLIMALIVSCAIIGVACDKINDMLFAPDGVSYDGQYVTWNKVDLAEYYLVQINGGDKVRSNSTTYAFASDETFEVVIYSVYDGSEKGSEAVTFRPLATIETITVSEKGVISWDAVPGANAYALTVNGQAAQTTDNTYDKLVAGANRVKVRPIVSGDPTYYSAWSKDVTVTILAAPTKLDYDGSTVTWLGNATNYVVTINGISETVRGNQFTYNSDNRDFTVSVMALGNHTGTYDSEIISEEFHYLATVTELYVVDGNVEWNPIPNAEGYKVKIGGVEQRGTLDAPKYDQLPSGRSVDVAVMPFNTTGHYFSSWSAERAVYVLESPVLSWNNALDPDGTAQENLTWNAVSAASGYTVRVTKDGMVDTHLLGGDANSFEYDFPTVGVYVVDVKANAAEGSYDYFDSKYSQIITVERLAAPKATPQDFIVSDKDNLTAGFTVNYLTVAGATGYQLYRDGALENGKFSTSAAIRVANVVEPSVITEQNITFVIRSMGGVKTVSGRPYVTLSCLTETALSFNIVVQATPQNPVMSGYIFGWEPVAGNNGYTVSYAGTSVTAQSESADLSTLNAGTYSVKVHTRGNGSNVLASNDSAPVTVQRLEAPKNIRITSDANGTLEWDEISNAKGYEAYLGQSQTALQDSAYENMYQFIDTNGTTLSMVTTANTYNDNFTVYYMSSQRSATQQFVRLAAPTFPEGALSNSVELRWNSPQNINAAEYTPTYRIFSAKDSQIGGSDLNGTRFNIEYLEGGRTHNFYVKAIGNGTHYLDSEYSDVIVVYKLATPVMTIEDGSYTWSSIPNATAYYMEIDKVKVTDEYEVAGNKYSYTPRYTTAGNHSVTLKAVGDGRSNVDSAAYAYTQVTKVLQTPTITYSYSSDSVVPGGTIDVTITTLSPNAEKYQYEIAGESIVSSNSVCSKVINNTGSFSVRVKALGGSFDAEEVYYVDSQYAGGASTDVVVLLGAPSLSNFRINSYGAITWGAVSGSIGYDYMLSFDGGAYSDPAHTQYNSLNPIMNHTQYHTITVKVRASGGNAGKVVASDWAEWTWTNSAA